MKQSRITLYKLFLFPKFLMRWPIKIYIFLCYCMAPILGLPMVYMCWYKDSYLEHIYQYQEWQKREPYWFAAIQAAHMSFSVLFTIYSVMANCELSKFPELRWMTPFAVVHILSWILIWVTSEWKLWSKQWK